MIVSHIDATLQSYLRTDFSHHAYGLAELERPEAPNTTSYWPYKSSANIYQREAVELERAQVVWYHRILFTSYSNNNLTETYSNVLAIAANTMAYTNVELTNLIRDTLTQYSTFLPAIRKQYGLQSGRLILQRINLDRWSAFMSEFNVPLAKPELTFLRVEYMIEAVRQANCVYRTPICEVEPAEVCVVE